jgi:hypothetical protein
LQDFRLACECLDAVRRIQRPEGSLTPYGNVIKEIRCSLLQFLKIEVVHEDRTVNVDADRLAKRSTFVTPIPFNNGRVC